MVQESAEQGLSGWELQQGSWEAATKWQLIVALRH